MFEKLARYFISKLPTSTKLIVSQDLLHEVLDSDDYSISDNVALDMIETIVKSSGNKVIDFIIKG